MLLNKALTLLEEEEDRQAAQNALAAATRRIGDCPWPEEHPAGRSLELANLAVDALIADDPVSAKRHLRESIQLVDAAARNEVDRGDGAIPDGGTFATLERADRSYHDIAQTHLHEFRGDMDLYPGDAS